MPILLFQRMLVGIFVGMITLPSNAPETTQAQIVVLSFVFFVFAVYLILVQPLIVYVANVFESALAMFQGLCCLLNLWLVSESGVVMGIAMTKEEATERMNWLITVAFVLSILRFVSVYLPTWPVLFLQKA